MPHLRNPTKRMRLGAHNWVGPIGGKPWRSLTMTTGVAFYFWRDLQQGSKDLSSWSLSYTLLEQRLAKIPICKIYESKTLVILLNLLHNALLRIRSKTKFAICKNYGSLAILQHVVHKQIKDQFCNLHLSYGSKILVTIFTMLVNAVQRNRSKTKIPLCKNYESKTLSVVIPWSDYRPFFNM